MSILRDSYEALNQNDLINRKFLLKKIKDSQMENKEEVIELIEKQPRFVIGGYCDE